MTEAGLGNNWSCLDLDESCECVTVHSTLTSSPLHPSHFRLHEWLYIAVTLERCVSLPDAKRCTLCIWMMHNKRKFDKNFDNAAKRRNKILHTPVMFEW